MTAETKNYDKTFLVPTHNFITIPMNSTDDINVEEASDAFSEMMAGVEAGVFEMIKKSSGAPRDAYEAWQAFSHAVG